MKTSDNSLVSDPSLASSGATLFLGVGSTHTENHQQRRENFSKSAKSKKYPIRLS